MTCNINSSNTKLCGNNNVITKAGKIMQRYQ